MEKRVIKLTKRYGHAYMIYYALSIEKDLESLEPKTFKDVFQSKEKN